MTSSPDLHDEAEVGQVLEILLGEDIVQQRLILLEALLHVGHDAVDARLQALEQGLAGTQSSSVCRQCSSSVSSSSSFKVNTRRGNGSGSSI
jgi:hypothetical protein